MESFLAEGQDGRIPELDVSAFKNQASYVLSRNYCTHSCPAPAVSPNSTRTAKFNISSGNFIDPGSIWFSYTCRNLGVGANGAAAGVLHPVSALGATFWRRMIIKYSGATVEDISHVNRLEAQIANFASCNKKRDYGSAAFGWQTLTDEGIDGLAMPIPAGGKKNVTWRPLCSGFLQSGKFLPLMGGSSALSVEIECTDFTDAIIDNGAAVSQQWELTELKLHYADVVLDSAMTESFADMLVAGESILIPFQANNIDKIFISGGANVVDLTVARQFSRLATVTCTLEGSTTAADSAINGTSAAVAHRKPMLNHFLPVASRETVESYLSLNSKRWPQFNTVGCQQHFIRLMQTLGIYNSVSHATNLSYHGYSGAKQGESGATQDIPARQFTFAWDLEAVGQAEASGEQVSGGAIVQIHLENIAGANAAFVATHYDCCLEIRQQGAVLFS